MLQSPPRRSATDLYSVDGASPTIFSESKVVLSPPGTVEQEFDVSEFLAGLGAFCLLIGSAAITIGRDSSLRLDDCS